MSIEKILRFLPLALIFLIICGCSNDKVGRLNANAPDISVSSRISDENSLIAYVDVTTDVDSRVYIEYGNNKVGYFKTSVTSAEKTHSIPLVRLIASTRYNFSIYLLDDKNVGQKKFSS